ncbi:hypothetical protein CTAM01_00977 [Colletotrichum tamarilloi]|uniref:Uncharacterized protein n=1 Tax=Colletotrichum tamarilloi TaxID=1209934 RepID=A0ABQ9RSR6_9PEZI|nr:uncharacterized protein CTAM01_00977 [Colletotrichum tamarilloi]KAK1512047.1 hypothetical protein CTAM01_00977 [Colletotrichum tamarilloi]
MPAQLFLPSRSVAHQQRRLSRREHLSELHSDLRHRLCGPLPRVNKP